MKRIMTIFLLLCGLMLAAFAAGCGQDEGEGKTVALLFPNPSAGGPWQYIGDTCNKQMQEAGYKTNFQFCSSPENQVQQLREAIAENPACIVIAAQDTGNLGEALAEAKEAGIPVVAYDRVIMHTDAISYYASFENSSVGEFMARYVEEKLNLKGGAGPFNIEFLAGDPADTNAPQFYGGAYDYLKPYIDKGQLVVRSGQVSFQDVATPGWSGEKAQSRMEDILRRYYSGGEALNIVIASNDDLAAGVLKAQQAVGYSGPATLLTGQDASKEAMENIRTGRQAMTIYKDPAVLCAKIVRMVKAMVEGSQPAVNDVTNIRNDKITIPSYLCIPVIVDRENLDIVKN